MGPECGGTSELAKMLSEHEEVALHPKSAPHFFDFRSGTELPESCTKGRKRIRIESYLRSFRAPASKFWIDATPSYFYWPGCSADIMQHNPEAKIVVVLREPIERVAAHVKKNQEVSCRNFLHEPRSLDVALAAEKAYRSRVSYPHHEQLCYQHQNEYVRLVIQLLEVFPATQVLFLDWWDVRQRPRQAVNQVTDFFELPRMSKLPKVDRDPNFWKKKLTPTVPAKSRSNVWRDCAPSYTELTRLTGLSLQDWLRL